MKSFSRLKQSILLLSIFSSLQLYSTEKAQPEFKVSPIGRIHVDGAVYFPEGNGFKPGAALSEIRAGARATYGDWMARIEVGYSYGKIGMKDVYIQRFFKTGNHLRLGYFIPQFGIRGGGSASYKPAMITEIPESFFRTTTRKIGLMYSHYDKLFSAYATAFVGGHSLLFSVTEQGKSSVGGSLRATIHPLAKPGNIFQAGISTSYETATHTRVTNDDGEEEASDGYRQFSANFPTTVCKVAMLEADVRDAVGDWKISPEISFAKGRFALETQYYYMSVKRTGSLPGYHASGVYAMLRGIVFGDKKYTFNSSESNIAYPSPKSFELVAAFNYTDANSKGSGIYGGIANDYSLTANYYINKYMIARLRYSYTAVHGSCVSPNRNVNTIQARLQFVF